MTMPRTIVITTLPSVGGNGALTSRSVSPTCNTRLRKITTHIETSSSLSSDGENKLDDGILQIPSRKRQRLDHLSLEEKIMRRKLKNRVAAQSARDRKKARMGELEEQVECLEKENRTLQKENSNLRKRNSELEKENAELKLQLWLQSKEASTPASIKEESSSESIGQAWFISGPLQKEQDLQLPILLMMQFVCLQVILSVMAFLTCYTSAVKNSVTSILHPLQVKKYKKSMQKGTFQERNRPLKWWGPHQQAWNPSKN